MSCSGDVSVLQAAENICGTSTCSQPAHPLRPGSQCLFREEDSLGVLWTVPLFLTADWGHPGDASCPTSLSLVPTLPFRFRPWPFLFFLEEGCTHTAFLTGSQVGPLQAPLAPKASRQGWEALGIHYRDVHRPGDWVLKAKKTLKVGAPMG